MSALSHQRPLPRRYGGDTSIPEPSRRSRRRRPDKEEFTLRFTRTAVAGLIGAPKPLVLLVGGAFGAPAVARRCDHRTRLAS
jgi:hypothetical protein